MPRQGRVESARCGTMQRQPRSSSTVFPHQGSRKKLPRLKNRAKAYASTIGLEATNRERTCSVWSASWGTAPAGVVCSHPHHAERRARAATGGGILLTRQKGRWHSAETQAPKRPWPVQLLPRMFSPRVSCRPQLVFFCVIFLRMESLVERQHRRPLTGRAAA